MIDSHLAVINKLDSNKRLGHKFELLGFDFILDEDLRVWLIEVNTCPYMGPVLKSQHDNFMVDLLNDVFKITIDNHFFNQEMTDLDVLNETQFELLWSSDGRVN